VSPVETYCGEREGGVGKEANHRTAKRPGPLQIIQYTLVLCLADIDRLGTTSSCLISWYTRSNYYLIKQFSPKTALFNESKFNKNKSFMDFFPQLG
jgi:hypothetical protein